MITDDKQLDNPVWHSLSETHQKFAINYHTIKFYHPDYCPFGGFKTVENIAARIVEYSTVCDNFFIVGDKPEVAAPVTLKSELVCNQMIMGHPIEMDFKDPITALTQAHAGDLLRLVNLVQPGYFKRKTPLLGKYYGIFKHGELIAVTGERMQMDRFIEVSAVVTHPLYTGNGYAKQLVAQTVNSIFNQEKKPYLHVAASNTGAIQLYEKLGFQTRRKISFWNLVS
jgi:GNAT superfamily N-acetyltransferase